MTFTCFSHARLSASASSLITSESASSCIKGTVGLSSASGNTSSKTIAARIASSAFFLFSDSAIPSAVAV